MNVDGIFKVPAAPAGGKKRKLGPTPDDAFLKKVKPNDDDEDFRAGWGPGKSNGKKSNKEPASTEIKSEEEEDARFYGSGLDEEHQKIWDIVDAGEEAPATIDLQTLKKIVLKFEKVINKNQELRVKYSDDPMRFIDSEADLDEEIKNMLTASSAPELYPTLVALGTHATILGLLSHENTDISLAAIELLNELTGEDVVSEASEEAERGMEALVRALVQSDALSLLVQNLARLDESKTEEDKQGVFNTLSVIENLVSVDPTIAEEIVAKTTFLTYLLQRIRTRTFDSNRQYASEILAILLQNSRTNRLKLGESGGIDTLLQVVSAYKRKDPKDPDEIEMMENFFDALCAALSEPEIKSVFLEAEGLELMLIMLKEKKMSRMRALKVLNHAMLGPDGAPCCAHFVEILGLKTLFPAFMRKGMKKYKKEYKAFSETEEDEHVVSIIASLFKSLTNQDDRDRLVHKFIENDFEKVVRMMEVRDVYSTKMAVADREIARRKKEREEKDLDDNEREAEEEEDFLKRLRAGLFTLQLVDFIIAFACFEDLEGRIKDKVQCLLKERGQSLDNIKAVLKEYAESIGEKSETTDGKEGSGETRINTEDGAPAYSTREKAMIIGVMEAL